MLIPETTVSLGETIEEEMRPGYTYKLDIEAGRIAGMIDELAAVRQAVYKILATERYKYLIYDWHYGREMENLIGQDMDYVKNDIKRVIKEALLTDERITDVTDFTFSEEDTAQNKLLLTFAVNSVEGNFTTEVAVNV